MRNNEDTKHSTDWEDTAMRLSHQVTELRTKLQEAENVLRDIIWLARDPAGSTFTLRRALRESEFKAAVGWLASLLENELLKCAERIVITFNETP
jgi:hypothetical protein